MTQDRLLQMMYPSAGLRLEQRVTADNRKLQGTHPAANVFRDHLLGEIVDENKKLRRASYLLELACSFLATIEIRLRDGRVISTSLKQPFADLSDHYLMVPIDSDPLPLMEFSSGIVRMMQQNIVSFPGERHIILGIRRNGAILLRFSLSKIIAVEGVLQGLSEEDHVNFQNKLLGGDEITKYLTTRTGLQNPDNALLFTPTMLLMETTPVLRTTIQHIRPLPPPTKDDLLLYLKTPHRPNLHALSPSDEMRISIVAALGHGDSQMDLLCENHLLRNERRRLIQIQKQIEKLETFHSLTTTKLLLGSLKDGKLAHSEGSPLWRIPLTISDNHAIGFPVSVFLSGIALKIVGYQTIYNETDQRYDCVLTYDNGAKMLCSYQFSPHEPINCLGGTLEFPLSCVRSALDVLEVKTH